MPQRPIRIEEFVLTHEEEYPHSSLSVRVVSGDEGTAVALRITKHDSLEGPLDVEVCLTEEEARAIAEALQRARLESEGLGAYAEVD